MSIRSRTTKLIARRHDLNYFKRMSPLRAWQWWLAAVALVTAVLWFSGNSFVHGNAAFSAGPMSSSHAVFGQRCELCHVPVLRSTSWTPSFGMRRHVPDSACLSCHIAAPHHPQETVRTPMCSSCHTEHTGAMHLAAVADSGCTQCHAQLSRRAGILQVAASIHSFAKDHPEFRALRSVEEQEAFPLKFSHAEHMQKNLSGLHGKVTLQCGSCHAPTLEGISGYTTRAREHPVRQGAAMAPVSFEKSCRSCHTLEFDAHISAEAPHADVAVVRDFVTQQIGDFAKAHPEVVADEIRRWPTLAPLPERVAEPAPRTQQEWVANRIVYAERILWREKCGLCHGERSAEFPVSTTGRFPAIGAPKQPHAWFASAVFSHGAHQAVACEECHTKALTSSRGTDVLMPSIATCRRCHDGASSPQGPAVKSGHAESGCFLCHVYHGADVADLSTARHKLDELLPR